MPQLQWAIWFWLVAGVQSIEERQDLAVPKPVRRRRKRIRYCWVHIGVITMVISKSGGPKNCWKVFRISNVLPLSNDHPVEFNETSSLRQ